MYHHLYIYLYVPIYVSLETQSNTLVKVNPLGTSLHYTNTCYRVGEMAQQVIKPKDLGPLPMGEGENQLLSSDLYTCVNTQ